jgi:hypothetical protein
MNAHVLRTEKQGIEHIIVLITIISNLVLGFWIIITAFCMTID